ncbi:MAG: hypothetical protein NTW54_04090 [Bacteroidetes bacterium]|nr:hypothetical protein [Bacteroidota bacterium]
MKRYTAISFFLLSLHFLNAREINPKRFSFAALLCPELSYYKSKTSQLVRPDASELLGLGWGWAGITSSWNYGLKISCTFTDQFSMSTGFFSSKTGSTIKFNSKPTSYYYSKTTGPISVSLIDSSYGLKNPDQDYFRLYERKYAVNYFMVPLSFRYNILGKEKKSACYYTLGTQFYFLRSANIQDDGQVIKNLSRTSKYLYFDKADDMNKFLVSITLGCDAEAYLGKNIFLLYGAQIGKGLSNTVKESSNYLMDEKETKLSFAKNGHAVPLNQKFFLNTFTLHLGLSFSF